MDLKQIAEKWQEKRSKENIYKVGEDHKKPKFYILDMFPYPSGAGLHVGHPKGYIATDVIARKKTLQGFNVLHPMGFDTFGLGTEQYAIEKKMKPQVVAQENIDNFKRQLKMFGLTYDRDRSFSTADPDYYKWTQKIFLELYNHYYDEKKKKAMPISKLKGTPEFLDTQRLAYVDYKPINRCPKCMTGLANEDLDDGKCERCASPVEQRPMKQRVLRITKYAERLLEGLENLKREESMKDLERNRIGKSEGTQFKMNIADSKDLFFEVYTTRIDTVFGMSFVVMAPEHELVDQITTKEYKKKIQAYKEAAKHKTQLERTELQKDKSGEFTGVYAINPFNNQKVPIFIADYVLANYGTGVVMAVPAHDERDFEFAKKYDLPITEVIRSVGPHLPLLEGEGQGVRSNNVQCFTEKGILNNSEEFTGLTSEEAITKMQTRLTKNKIGGKKINYKMQDRVFSRQRYRGEPFPIVRTEDGKAITIDEKDLPVKLPDVDNYEPTGTTEGPLANITDRVNITLPDGTKAKRETNTMPGRAGSSRYRLRYMDPKNKKELVSAEREKYRGSVDVYVGGAEHVTRHMIYARFWQKFLCDIGTVTHDEPFQEYHYVGLIMAEDGRKMSKRRGNVVDPDTIINEFGHDTFRVYEMFMGPFDQAIARSTNGVKGTKKFLEKIIALQDKINDAPISNETNNLLHQTIKKITEDIDGFKFNTCISQLMILVNHLTELEHIDKKTYEILTILISPFAPHLAEELRSQLGNEFSIFTKAQWPAYDEKLLSSATIKIGVQFNGKVRGDITISKEATQEEVMTIVKADEKLKVRLGGEPKKIIYVQGKILNIVI